MNKKEHNSFEYFLLFHETISSSIVVVYERINSFSLCFPRFMNDLSKQFLVFASKQSRNVLASRWFQEGR